VQTGDLNINAYFNIPGMHTVYLVPVLLILYIYENVHYLDIDIDIFFIFIIPITVSIAFIIAWNTQLTWTQGTKEVASAQKNVTSLVLFFVATQRLFSLEEQKIQMNYFPNNGCLLFRTKLRIGVEVQIVRVCRSAQSNAHSTSTLRFLFADYGDVGRFSLF
jgi:hypothetical protein